LPGSGLSDAHLVRANVLFYIDTAGEGSFFSCCTGSLAAQSIKKPRLKYKYHFYSGPESSLMKE